MKGREWKALARAVAGAVVVAVLRYLSQRKSRRS